MEVSGHYLPEDPLHRRGQFLRQVQADSAAVATPNALVDKRVSIWPGCRGSQGCWWQARCTSGWGRYFSLFTVNGPYMTLRLWQYFSPWVYDKTRIRQFVLVHQDHPTEWEWPTVSLNTRHCFSPKATNIAFLCSTTEEEPPTTRCVFLGWLTCPSN